MTIYALSVEAERDLGFIYDYTEEQHGADQAARYLAELDAVFNQLVGNPKLGRERHDIRKGLRSITPNRHIIFYRITGGQIRIVRVLYGGRDLPRLL